MSERRTIVYAGGFVLPAGNASAQRVLETGRLIREVGYDVVLVGQLPDDAGAPVHELEVEGFRAINIHAPRAGGPYPYYKNSAASLLSALDLVGPANIHAVIAYNYPSTPLADLIRAGRRHGFHTVAECADWYSWEGRRVFQNLRRLAATEVRIRLLTRMAGNVICTSRWGAGEVFAGLHTLVLPWVIDETKPKWNVEPLPRTERRRFVYVGSPGRGLTKDYLHLMIEALAALKAQGRSFDFQIAGVTAADILDTHPALAPQLEALKGELTLHGRIPHPEAVSLLRSADFSVFVRPDNRVSAFGFPTKLAEAFACGVPSMTTPTSDIPLYVRDGDNGLLLKAATPQAILTGFERALAMSDAEVEAMRAQVAADNPFSPAKWRTPMASFLERLR